ncbi:MAG: helix-turn-helix domain-containing protein [Prevotella sp.]|jgi:AraC-like DNA-binding protein
MDKNQFKEVIASNEASSLWDEDKSRYVAHVMCTEGYLTFSRNDQQFTLHAGEGMILRVRKDVHPVEMSKDLKLNIIFVTPEFLEICTPRNNYGIRGSLSLFNNPVMTMRPDQFEQLVEDMRVIKFRLNQSAHLFRYDILICSTETLFLDYFDAHATQHGSTEVSFQNTDIISRFMQMLQNGEYVKNREVQYYADKLFVTPKYLSEVCKEVTGLTANYWITRFTTIHIRRLLRDKQMSFTEIADMFNFSSQAYFSRFVLKNLGVSPTKFRE